MEIDKKFMGLIFASLVHDVGKFIQKTNLKSKYKSDREEYICPKDGDGIFLTHKHVSYTDGFLSKLDKELSKEGLRHLFEDVPYKASFHHIRNPSDPLEIIIQKADHYSSGSDRSKKENEEEGKWYEVPLISILSEVNLSEGRSLNYKKISLNPLTPENFISSIKGEDFKLTKDAYSEFWLEFEREFLKLIGKFYRSNPSTPESYFIFFRSLNSLLEKYWWCIPSTVKDMSDISLYDHSFTTAGIASVMYKYHMETNTINDGRKIENNSLKKFLLISGDISGIQNYIFNIKKSSFAAKTLRARSFQIQVLMENISGYILRKFALPVFCRILNAAGRFQILLPNTKKVKEELKKIKVEVEKSFKEQFFGELTFNISEPVEFAGEDFKLDRFQHKVLDKLHEKIEVAKMKKLSTVLLSNEDFILDHEYKDFTSDQGLCPLCEKHPITTTKNDIRVCKFCSCIVDIGTRLPKAKYILWDYDNFMSFPNFREKIDNNNGENNFSVQISKINEVKVPFSRFSSPFYVPMHDEDVLTFEDLSKNSEGVRYLAMFKADLDNLGLIFLSGLGEKKSISRIAALSRVIHFFFSEYLTHFVKENFPNLYVIFSGGDDVCLVGPWDEVIDFSNSFYKEFQKFTGNNNSITLSAGITLFHHNYPIYNVAEESENALKKAKDSSPSKNAVTIFNITCSWDTFKRELNFGKKLTEKLRKEVITRGMLYRLLKYAKMKENVEKEGKYVDAIWRSKLYYDVARNLKVPKNEEVSEKENLLIEFNHLLSEKEGKVAVSYAIYKTRD